MPKKRTQQNKGLPTRWRKKNNAYYYRVPPGLEHLWDDKKEFRLGSNLPEAHVTYGKRIKNPKPVKRICDLMEKYQLIVVGPQKPKTRESKETSYRRLLPGIGHLQPDELTHVMVNEIMDHMTAKYGTAPARIAYSYLHHMFKKALDWGIVENNPVSRATKPKAGKRDRYVEHWELSEALKVAPPTIRAHIFLKLVSGLRRSDILTLRTDTVFRTPQHALRLSKHPEEITIDDLHLGGLPIQARKTRDSSGKVNLIQWQPQLISAIQYALSSNPCMNPEYLILTRYCKCFFDFETGKASGFDSLWQRWQRKALKNTLLKERFQEKDLRAKVASDTDLQHASKLLGHTSQQITKEVYRRRGEEVEPAMIDQEILKNLAPEKTNKN